MPDESGPRSVMPISIGTMSAPSSARSSGRLTSRPTIPHMTHHSSISPWNTPAGLRLEHLDVPRRFPVAHVARVLDPFHALQIDELLREVGPEPALYDLVRLERIHCIAQVLRQKTDPAALDLLRREFIEVLVRGLTGIEPALDAVEPRRENGSGGEIGVARTVGQPHLDPPIGNAHAGRTVVVTVRDVGRRPGRTGKRATHDETLVRVDRRCTDRRECARVCEQAAEELVTHRRHPESTLVLVVVEQVLALGIAHRDVEVRAGAGAV